MSDWTFCPKCATRLTPGAPACPGCGTQLRELTPTGAEPPSVAEETNLEAELQEALQPTYLLVKRLGAGGMGAVFLAREPALKRSVAVKVLSAALAADPNARARFEREAQAVARRTHPNVVAIHALGELRDGRPYFVMQYVDGPSLSERVETEGPLGVEETKRLIGEVASALAAAHARGIIHRDVKPANVLYDRESGRALVTDFGIAAVRAAGETGAPLTRLTGTGLALGTPQYMSPEQLLAEQVTERTDIYGLGLVGYELLTGRAPFAATTPQELIAAHLRDTPTPIATLRPEVDPELDAVLGRCLAKHADARPTAAEVAQRLLPGAGALLEWPPPGLAPLHGGLVKAGNRFTVAAVLLALALWAGAGTTSPAAQTSLAGVLLFLLGLGALVGMGAVLPRLTRLTRHAWRAVRSGYDWYTVLEVLSDTRGDTGRLVAGQREYATIPDARRVGLRVRRVLRAVLVPAAGLLVPVALVSMAALGRPLWILVFGVPGLVLATGIVLERREFDQFRRARRALARDRSSRQPVGDLVRPWYAVFDRVEGTRTARRIRGHPGVAILGIGSAILALMLAALFVPVFLVAALGPGRWSGWATTLQDAPSRMASTVVVRPFALPADSAISARQAGTALWALEGAPVTGWAPEQPVPEVVRQPWPPLAAGFGATCRVPDGREQASCTVPGSAWAEGPNPDSVILQASRGLSLGEREYLALVASSPNWDLVRTVARAPSVDYLGSRYVMPFPDTVETFSMPIKRISSTKGLAFANASRVAFHVSRGDWREAERAAREIISVGFRLIDEGEQAIDAYLGVVIVAIGRSQLLQVFTLTGDPRLDGLQGRVESAVAMERQAREAARRISPSGGSIREAVYASVLDKQAARGLRLELLMALMLAPCTNARELLFGPGPDAVQAFDIASRTMVRHPSDEAYLEMIRTMPRRVGHSAQLGSRSLPTRAMVSLAGLSGRMLGNERVRGCVRIALDF
jgi:hypothetical protein